MTRDMSHDEAFAELGAKVTFADIVPEMNEDETTIASSV